MAFATGTALMLLGHVSPAAASDFAAEVVTCVPAPGQYVNQPTYNEPNAVLGPPETAGGTQTPDNGSVLSLGGFGGSVVLRFDHTVIDDPGNYLGLDFIVFGNAYWASNDPQRRWGEPAHVEIMRDLDSNGLPGTTPGERWYLIPGSRGLAVGVRRSVTWDDLPDATYPPANPDWFPWIGVYPYFPTGPSVIPLDENGRYVTDAYEIPDTIYADPAGQGGLVGVIVNPNSADGDPENDANEALWGYADMSPTLRLGDLDGDNVIDDAAMTVEQFFTVPDNPYRVGVTPGSGGGDAFDIAWAIDPDTGAPAGLEGFDFVRLTTTVDRTLGFLGEVSSEIDAVADVRPVACPGDVNGDAAVDLVDLVHLRNRLGTVDPEADFAIPGDVVQDGAFTLADLAVTRGAYLGVACE